MARGLKNVNEFKHLDSAPPLFLFRKSIFSRDLTSFRVFPAVTRADSTKFALDAAAALAEPLPEPPLELSADALRFWETIVNAKRRNAWTDSDLLIACALCRDLALVERLSRELEVDGPTLENRDG